MTNRTKNIFGGAGFVVLIVGAAAYAAYTYWPAGTNVEDALKLDLTGYDAARTQELVVGLKLEGATMEQKVKLFDKLRKHFETMMPGEKLKLMNAGRKMFEENPEHPLVINTREVMKAYWHEQFQEYVKADGKARKDMLDKRIDEQEAMENMRKMKAAADAFMGKKPSVETKRPEMSEIQRHIGKMIEESMRNGLPEDRAAAQEFFGDMRKRRVERGLEVLF